MISIIIPALNEEKYLPRLLKNIKDQDYHGDYEIIVADAGSSDRTLDIAKENGINIVKGGNPSVSRNAGARVAKGQIFVFIDADTLLPKDFLSKGIREFNDRKLDAGFFNIRLDTKNVVHKFFFYILYMLPVKLFYRISPHGSVVFFVKKYIHEKIKGFREDVIFLEDVEYVRRLYKSGKYRLIKSTYLIASTRRLNKQSFLKVYVQNILGDMYLNFIGPITKDIFKYGFGHHD